MKFSFITGYEITVVTCITIRLVAWLLPCTSFFVANETDHHDIIHSVENGIKPHLYTNGIYSNFSCSQLIVWFLVLLDFWMVCIGLVWQYSSYC